jgi:hypothetical protein
MRNWSWKEGFRFALATELFSEEGIDSPYKMSLAERFGSWLLSPLYRMIDLVAKKIQQPLVISLFTILTALFAALVFYNIPAFVILGKLFPSKVVRCLLFLYVELNFFAMGCRTFGRFNNKILVELWKKGRLEALFPGDRNAWK